MKALIARKKISAAPVEKTTLPAEKIEKKNLFVLFGLQPSWDMERIATGLRELKQSFESPKVIICSEQYLDDLVQRCEEFEYDAYLLTCDSGEELKKAVNNVEAGKLYLSRSVITSYCIMRRREWAS